MYEFDPTMDSGMFNFYSDHYRRHNEARLQHLESLGLPLRGRSVLEVGSGPGHHTWFYAVRGCEITATDARPECLAEIRKHFPSVKTALVNMNDPDPLLTLGTFDIVHCYGLLYHLEDPARAIAALSRVCSDSLLLETCVTPGSGSAINLTEEIGSDYTQSVTNVGCRPTRQWLFDELKKHFGFVYQTRTQPDHEEFPVDWTSVDENHGLVRIVTVSSRQPIDNDRLSAAVLDQQSRFKARPSSE